MDRAEKLISELDLREGESKFITFTCTSWSAASDVKRGQTQEDHMEDRSVLPVPVGQLHHDVKRGQAEDKVKEEVRVAHNFSFIVYHFLTTKQGRIVPCEKNNISSETR